MKKIRVIHVVYSFATGGMEKGIATIVRNASDDFEHVIVCLHSSGETERLLPEGTPVVELYKPEGNSPVFIWQLSRTLKSFAPAIVHTRNWGGMDGIIAARLAGIRSTIQGEHGWLIDDPDGRNPKRLKLRQFLNRWVREYTCVSQHLQQWLVNIAHVKTPITHIYNGVDTQKYCPGEGRQNIRDALGISERTFLIGIVGRLDPIKDHPVLFEAFTAIRKENPDSCLLVIGDGSERERLEGLAGDGILFLGNRLDIPDILQTLDIFVLPSRNEGISNTILEAMATGIPVIATRVGGNPELVIDGITGTLIPPQDARAITLALLAYLKNPEMRKSHGEQGRKRTMQLFSIETMVNDYETVYRRLDSPSPADASGL